jgi:hypothetical protein
MTNLRNFLVGCLLCAMILPLGIYLTVRQEVKWIIESLIKMGEEERIFK